MVDKVSKLKKDVRTYIRQLMNDRSKMFLRIEEKEQLDKEIAYMKKIEEFIKLNQIKN